MQELFIIEGSIAWGAKQRTLWSAGRQDCFEIIFTGYNQTTELMETASVVAYTKWEGTQTGQH